MFTWAFSTVVVVLNFAKGFCNTLFCDADILLPINTSNTYENCPTESKFKSERAHVLCEG